MKIALVHEWLTSVAGSERCLLEMKKIYPEAPIYTSIFDSRGAAAFSGYDIRTSYLQKLPLIRKKREILVPLTPLAFEQFDLSEYDIVISNCHMSAKGVITKPDTIHICYCHTPARYLWEPGIDPRAKDGRFAWLKSRTAHKLRLWDRVAADRVDYFFANSNYIANRIKKYYGRESKVIYPPVDIDRFKVLPKEEVGDYYLFVSRLIGYKKCDLVVNVFNKLGLPLKVIGRGPERDRLQKRAKSNIEFLGHLSDQEIVDYYSRAKAFIFPAEEDFGIVSVEAMASGRPVIAYKVGGSAETVLDGIAGKHFANQNEECLIEEIRKFDHTKYEPVVIRKHAENFSATRFRKEFSEAVEKIAGSKKIL